MKERKEQKPADLSAETLSIEELLVFGHFLRSAYESWQRMSEALIVLIEQYINKHPSAWRPANKGGRA